MVDVTLAGTVSDTIPGPPQIRPAGYRLVTCRICHKVGIVKGQMAMHFCMKDGQLLQGEKITYREPHLEIVRLLIPAQLLVHPVFGTRLQSWAAERVDTISLERSRCCYENDIPSGACLSPYT